MESRTWQTEGVGREAASQTNPAVEATYRKVTRRLIPFLFICYVAAYLDRINVGFAQLQMREALAFSDAVYGLGAGIFFAGYFLFEVPSNLMLERIGARKTLVRIMILWGTTSAAMMFVRTPTSFYVMRFLLGVFEAGFFPGIIFYLTYWYPARRRARVMALFLTAVASAGVLGGPLSGWALAHLDGVHGLAGWQWLFLTQGLPSCLLGIAAYLYLDDRPQEASWLSPEEKNIIVAQLREDAGDSTASRHLSFGESLKTPRVYAIAFAWFNFICGVYAISFWLPTMIRSTGVTDVYLLGVVSTIPYGLAIASMVAVSRHSDRTGERRWHTAACAVVGAAALAATPWASSGGVFGLAVISIATAAIFTLQPMLWAIATDYLGGTRAAAGGIALINSLGLTGGFVSPTILGWVKATTGSLTNGLYVIAVLLVIGALVTLALRARSVVR